MKKILALLTACLLVSCYTHNENPLEQIRARGIIRVATVVDIATYQTDQSQPSGAEYDLITQLAAKQGLGIEVIRYPNINSLYEGLARGQADIAAANLSPSKQRKKRFLFSDPFMQVKRQLVFRRGENRPRRAEELSGSLVVSAGTAHHHRLQKIQADWPQLKWRESKSLNAIDLLELINDNAIDYALVYSNQLDLMRLTTPELMVGFSMDKQVNLSWAVLKTETSSDQNPDSNDLLKLINASLVSMRQSGELEVLLERHYGHARNFDYVDNRTFIRHTANRLPKFRQWFIEAAADQVDWRLTAAQGYQESHWRPRAKSPTGVRGLMMLTLPTAKQLGVKSRLDPKQSIFGGTRYLLQLKDRIPDRISEPDRTWMALAAYNIGFGHLEDVRILTQRQGGNPDSWAEISQRLPLLREKRYYRKLKYGFARGDEAATYVKRIRRYFEILKQLEDREFEVVKTDTEIDFETPKF
ncbi:membrane-bound lytic murein transglycosylase MltF [Pelagibaculum spongiae]|uniref:Membrane-bound lytic murein transglycosylase F n=2 Tax=Pelagibaculum spongiae TaxID=2080658 RepID=A0A2V1GZM6_9GAMM|nr:membrane-bound lytic murein transglycosylase MltF [Pelagibaculum spongiae]